MLPAATSSPFEYTSSFGDHSLKNTTGFVPLNTLNKSLNRANSQTSSVFLGMGESNCAWNRRALLHRDTMLAAAAVYRGKEAARSPSQAHYCPVPCHPYPLKSHCPF